MNEGFSPSRYTFGNNDDCLILQVRRKRSISEVTDCIRIDPELHVQPFFKEQSVPLVQWFRYGRNCRLYRKDMFKNFLAYLQSRKELHFSAFEELHAYT